MKGTSPHQHPLSPNSCLLSCQVLYKLPFIFSFLVVIFLFTGPLIARTCSAGGIGSALCNPFDLMKTRFQSVLPGQPLPYKGTLHGRCVSCGSKLLSLFSTPFSPLIQTHTRINEGLYMVATKDGLGGLYKGWTVTSARSAVLTSAQLGSYDTIKNDVLKKRVGMEEGLELHLASSMLAGVLTATAANPFDTVKSRFPPTIFCL